MPDDDIRESVRDLLHGKLLGLGSDDEKAWELRHMLDAILDYYLGDEDEEDQVDEVEEEEEEEADESDDRDAGMRTKLLCTAGKYAALPAVRGQIKKLAGQIPDGWRLATKLEAKDAGDSLVRSLGQWDICELADGWKIGGRGYGAKIEKSSVQERNGWAQNPLSHKIICPELGGLGSKLASTDTNDILRAAISIGAPTYNRGDIQGCGQLYRVAAELVLPSASPADKPRLADGLKRARNASSWNDAAWALRHAFDDVLDS